MQDKSRAASCSQSLSGIYHLPAPPLSLSLYMFSGGPTLYSKQDLSRKSDVLTFSCTLFLFSLVLMLCDCMFQRGLSLCKSVLRTVCCYGLFHEASVYIPPLKIEAVFGNTAADSHVTCRSAFSVNVWLPCLISFLCFFSSYSFFSIFPEYHILISVLSPSPRSDLSFHAFLFTPSALSLSGTWLQQYKQQCYLITLILLAALTAGWLAGWKHRHTKTGLGYCRSTQKIWWTLHMEERSNHM